MLIREINDYNDKIYTAVRKLIPQLGSEIIVPTEEHLKDIIKSGTEHFFALELDNDEIAGILTLCIYSIPTGRKAWIEDVVVDKSHRGKGYGKELMLHAIEFARSDGAITVELTSRPSRIEANNLYLRLGFKRRETNLYRFSLQ